MNAIKNQMLQLSLLALICTPILADIHDRIEYKLNRVLRDVEIINNEIAAECTVIRPEDFEDADGNLSQTYVISAPGKYCLGEDISFAPTPDAFVLPAIQILSSDVTLDLCNHTLQQVNQVPLVYSIIIGQGYFYDDPNAVVSNVTITNGTISQFTGSGILAYNGGFDDPSFIVTPFTDLHFTNLNVLDCGITGFDVDFLGAQGICLASGAPADSSIDITFPFKNILIENCNVNRCIGGVVGAAAIVLYTFDNAVISNCQANDTITANAFGSGAITAGYFLTGRNLQMDNCQGNGTMDLDPTNNRGEVGGAFIQASTNVYVKDCQFNDSFGEADYIVDNNLSVCFDCVYENCQFNNSRGGKQANLVAGVHCSSGFDAFGSGYKFINCQFNGASVDPEAPGGNQNAEAMGFLAIALSNMSFENCQACNIHAPLGFNAQGFSVGMQPYGSIIYPNGNVFNINFTNCVASDISSGGDYTAGFEVSTSNLNSLIFPALQGLQSNFVFENCIAERIYSTEPTSRVVAGIAQVIRPGKFNYIRPDVIYTEFSKQTNLFVKNCRISDVHSNVEIARSAGILVESVENPVVIGNSVSDCDRGILLTGTDEIIPNGFQLAATFADATAFPPVFINLNTIPAAAPIQDFFNITQGNSVSIAPDASTINVDLDFIFPAADLTALGWQPGDTIFYDCNGGSPISDLVCTTTYFLIVYIPGFSENGVVQQNEVDNCSISGYQDDAQTTLSAWVDNTAFNNGSPVPSDTTNYAIAWAGVDPVDAGTLAAYPTPGNKYYNLSLIP